MAFRHGKCSPTTSLGVRKCSQSRPLTSTLPGVVASKRQPGIVPVDARRPLYIFTSTCTIKMLFAIFLVFPGLPQSPYPILQPPSVPHFCPLLCNMAAPVSSDLLGMLTTLLRAAQSMKVVVCACMCVNMCIVHRVHRVTCASWHAKAASGLCLGLGASRVICASWHAMAASSLLRAPRVRG